MVTEDAQDPEDEQVARFNESFYRSDPADYLRTRFQLLMLTGGKRSQLEELLAEGVEFAGVTIGPTGPEVDHAGDADDDSALGPFLTIESQQLLHHAAETVLRLFLVHASRATVPWVELSSQRSFSKFKREVESEFIDEAPAAELIGYVCFGNRIRPPDVDPADWDGAVSGIRAFLRSFAECFLDDANLYNSIKHGLGVTAGEAVALIDAHQVGHGPSIEYPESAAWAGDGTRTWSLTTRWVDVGQSIGLTFVAIRMIETIWSIGRFRHIGGPSAAEIFFPSAVRPDDLRGPDRPPMRRMSWHLLRESKHPAS